MLSAGDVVPSADAWSLDCGFARFEVFGSETRGDIDYGLVPYHFQHASLVIDGHRISVREPRELFPGDERVDRTRMYVVGSARCHSGTLQQFCNEPALQQKSETEDRVRMDAPFDECASARCRALENRGALETR